MEACSDPGLKRGIRCISWDINQGCREENRGSGTGVKFRTIIASHKIKQWRNFLSEADNKTSLIKFLVEEWKSSSYRAMVGNKLLHLTCGEECWKITSDGCYEVHELSSSLEEADKRVLLHAKHASDNGYSNVFIVSANRGENRTSTLLQWQR